MGELGGLLDLGDGKNFGRKGKGGKWKDSPITIGEQEQEGKTQEERGKRKE